MDKTQKVITIVKSQGEPDQVSVTHTGKPVAVEPLVPARAPQRKLSLAPELPLERKRKRPGIKQ